MSAASTPSPEPTEPGAITVRFAVARSFDRTNVARAVLCFGGIGTGAEVNCWQSLGPQLLAGHDVAVFVTLAGNALPAADVPVAELAERVARSVDELAGLCGLELRIVCTAGYSAGCDLAVAVGSAIGSVREAICVSGYAGMSWLPCLPYLALRQRRSRREAAGLGRWRSRWREFVPRDSLRLTMVVGRPGGWRRLLATWRSDRTTALEMLDELVAVRCTARYARGPAGRAARVETRPVGWHSWSLWRDEAGDLFRPDGAGGSGIRGSAGELGEPLANRSEARS